MEGGDWHNHVPSPESMVKLAQEHHYILDDTAYELVCGRWAKEILELPWALDAWINTRSRLIACEISSLY